VIERELAHLFGPVVAAECWSIPTALEVGQARRIGELADTMRVADSPREQRELVQAMSLSDQLLLCRWLADRDYAAFCVSTGK